MIEVNWLSIKLEEFIEISPFPFIERNEFSVYSRVQKSIENFVFRPKMATFQRVEMREGGLPLPLAFCTFDLFDMKSL